MDGWITMFSADIFCSIIICSSLSKSSLSLGRCNLHPSSLICEAYRSHSTLSSTVWNVCVYVCSIVGSRMMLSRAMDPKGVTSLLQTIKPSPGLSPLPEKKQALLHRHAHTNRRVNIHCNHRSEVQIPLNLTGEAGDLYHSNTACPFPSVTLQLFPSLISSSCCAPYQASSSLFLPWEVCSTKYTPSPSHLPFIPWTSLTARATFLPYIRHICHNHFRTTVSLSWACLQK